MSVLTVLGRNSRAIMFRTIHNNHRCKTVTFFSSLGIRKEQLSQLSLWSSVRTIFRELYLELIIGHCELVFLFLFAWKKHRGHEKYNDYEHTRRFLICTALFTGNRKFPTEKKKITTSPKLILHLGSKWICRLNAVPELPQSGGPSRFRT